MILLALSITPLATALEAPITVLRGDCRSVPAPVPVYDMQCPVKMQRLSPLPAALYAPIAVEAPRGATLPSHLPRRRFDMFALRNPSRAHGLKGILRHISTSPMAMDAAPKKRLIEKKLTEGLAPVLLQVEDVSHQHAGHAGAPRGSSETHFNVTVVSEQFQGRSLLKRHRLVYDLLQEELQHGGVHALSLNTKTPAEDYICDFCETNYGPWSEGRASSPKPCSQQSKPTDNRSRKESPLCETCEAERASKSTKQKRKLKIK